MLPHDLQGVPREDRLRVALIRLPVERVLPDEVSEPLGHVPLVAVGAVGTAEHVSGKFLGHLVSHGCLLCQLFTPSQGIEALRG